MNNFTSSFTEVLAALAGNRRAREGLATFVARHSDSAVPAANYRCGSAEAAAIGAFLEKAGLERGKAWTTVVSQLDPDTCQIRWLDKGQDGYGEFRTWAACLTPRDASLLVPTCAAGGDPCRFLPVPVEAPAAEESAGEGPRPAPDTEAIIAKTVEIARVVADAFDAIPLAADNRALFDWATVVLSSVRAGTGSHDPVAPLAAVELYVRRSKRWSPSPDSALPPWPGSPLFSRRLCRRGTVVARPIRDGEALPAGAEIMSLPLPEQLGNHSPLDGYMCRTASELRSVPTSDKVAVWVQVDAPIDPRGCGQALPDGGASAAFAGLRFAMDSEAMKNYVCDLYSEAYGLEVEPLGAARLAVHNLESLDPRFAPRGAMPFRAALFEDDDEGLSTPLGCRVGNSVLGPGTGLAWRCGLLFLPEPPSRDPSRRSSCGVSHSPLPVVYGPPPSSDPADEAAFARDGLLARDMPLEWYSMVHGTFRRSPGANDADNLAALRRIVPTTADCMPNAFPVPAPVESWTQSTAFVHAVVAALRRSLPPGTELPFTAPENRPAGTADYVFAGIWSGVANGNSADVADFGGEGASAWPRFRGFHATSGHGLFALPRNPALECGTAAALASLRSSPEIQSEFSPTAQTVVGELADAADVDSYQVVVETNVDADGYVELLNRAGIGRASETFRRLSYVFCSAWVEGRADPTCALNEPWEFVLEGPSDLDRFVRFLGPAAGSVRPDSYGGTAGNPYGNRTDVEDGCLVEFARDAAGRLVIVFSMSGTVAEFARSIWCWRTGIPVFPALYLARRAVPTEFRLPPGTVLVSEDDVRRYLTLEIMQPGAFDAGTGPYAANAGRYLGPMWRQEDVGCLDAEENVPFDMYTSRMVVHVGADGPF